MLSYGHHSNFDPYSCRYNSVKLYHTISFQQKQVVAMPRVPDNAVVANSCFTEYDQLLSLTSCFDIQCGFIKMDMVASRGKLNTK